MHDSFIEKLRANVWEQASSFIEEEGKITKLLENDLPIDLLFTTDGDDLNEGLWQEPIDLDF